MPGDTFTIKVGVIDGNTRAVRLEEALDNNRAVAEVYIRVVMGTHSENLSYYYAADLNFFQGDTNMDRKILMGKT
jgi:hypothetical protein